MFSPHQKDAYQIISQKDIPNQFYYSEAHCSAVDLLRNQTCLSASGCTAGFPCWPTQRYPDVAVHSSLCKLTAYLQLLCSPQVRVAHLLLQDGPSKTAFLTSDCVSASSREQQRCSPPRQPRGLTQLHAHLRTGADTGKDAGSCFMLSTSSNN